MELRVLNYFLMVAREENITKAAKLLHITQPTLSRQLMQLEDELGVKLFERSSHNIMLTSDGLLLRRRAQELIDLADKAKRELTQKNDISGLISIGSGEYQSSMLLAELLAAFLREYPNVKYDFYSGNSDNIKERIERGILDFGLLFEPVEISKYDFLRMPFKEQWGVLVKENSPLALKECITPADFEGKSVIHTSRGLVRNELLNWLGDYAEKINFIAGGNLPYNPAMLAKCGDIAYITIKLNCKYDGLVFVPLAPALEFGTLLAWKKSQPYSSAASAFLEYAKKYIKGITDNAI